MLPPGCAVNGREKKHRSHLDLRRHARGSHDLFQAVLVGRRGGSCDTVHGWMKGGECSLSHAAWHACGQGMRPTATSRATPPRPAPRGCALAAPLEPPAALGPLARTCDDLAPVLQQQLVLLALRLCGAGGTVAARRSSRVAAWPAGTNMLLAPVACTLTLSALCRVGRGALDGCHAVRTGLD